MILIECPWCGERAQSEYTYIGEADLKRPDPEAGSDEQWADYIYTRENRKGPHDEIWQHSGGCRQFVKVRRNTVTHEVIATAAPGDVIQEAGQ